MMKNKTFERNNKKKFKITPSENFQGFEHVEYFSKFG